MYLWRYCVFGLFQKVRSSLIGVDINMFSANLIELGYQGDSLFLKAFKRAPMPQKQTTAEDQSNEDMLDTEAYGEALNRLLKKNKFSSKHAVSAVPTSSIITRKLIVDASLKDEDMETEVILEAEQVIPYPIDEVALDFEVVGENSKDPEKVDIMLVACRKQTVDDREGVLAVSGLKAEAIDVVSYAMERAFPLVQQQLSLPEDNNHIALINIGDTFTTLNIIKNNESVYVRSSPSGFKQMVELMSQKNKTSFQQALEFYTSLEITESKHTIGKEQALQATRQLNQMLEQYYSSEHAPVVNHIVLSGGIPGLDELSKKISTLVNIQCSLANPFVNMELASSINQQQLNKSAPAFFVACGLAMRNDL